MTSGTIYYAFYCILRWVVTNERRVFWLQQKYKKCENKILNIISNVQKSLVPSDLGSTLQVVLDCHVALQTSKLLVFQRTFFSINFRLRIFQLWRCKL